MYLQEQPVASSKMICARLHTAGSECDRNTSSARLRSLHPRAIVPSMAASPGSSGLSKTSDILETSQFPFQEQLFRRPKYEIHPVLLGRRREVHKELSLIGRTACRFRRIQQYQRSCDLSLCMGAGSQGCFGRESQSRK